MKDNKVYENKVKLAEKFYELDWSDEEVRSLTAFCGSLNDAINHLAYRLLRECDLRDESRYLILCRVLITAGFNKSWSRTPSN